MRIGCQAPETFERRRLASNGVLPLLLFLPVLACSSPATPEEEDRVLLTVSASPEEQGVWGIVRLRADVADENGMPLGDREVEWRVVGGGGLVGFFSDLSPPEEGPVAGKSATERTDQTGLARTSWRLGSLLGSQTLEVSTEGSETVVVEMVTMPGVVLVGAWRTDLPYLQDLPSDTIRVHAVDAEHIRQAREWHDSGASARIGGSIRAGSGIDTAWAFHFDPSWARATQATFGTSCTSRPPLTVEEAAALQGTLYVRTCPWILDLVRIEEVPAWYLEDLGGGGP